MGRSYFEVIDDKIDFLTAMVISFGMIGYLYINTDDYHNKYFELKQKYDALMKAAYDKKS